MPATPSHIHMAVAMAGALLVATPSMAGESAIEDVRAHAEQHVQQLRTLEQRIAPAIKERRQGETSPSSNPDQFLIGQGQGDLSKGKLVCQRVSELAARADIAKQIRVQIKEHAIDRLRERSGREPEQDLEVVREEIVQEYLQGVTIIDRRIDDEAKTCSAVAVMPKPTLHAAPAGESPAADSSARR